MGQGKHIVRSGAFPCGHFHLRQAVLEMRKSVAKPAAGAVSVVVLALGMVCVPSMATKEVDPPVLLPPWAATWVMNLSTIIQVIDRVYA